MHVRWTCWSVIIVFLTSKENQRRLIHFHSLLDRNIALCCSGVRPALGVTQFPAGVTTAATWDRELIYNRSLAMGQEFRDQGVVSLALSSRVMRLSDPSTC
jgi:hypothetical protein